MDEIWKQRFAKPIYLADGSILRTMEDAAHWILRSSEKEQLADIAKRLMDVAVLGDIQMAETALRIALFRKLDFKRRE